MKKPLYLEKATDKRHDVVSSTTSPFAGFELLTVAVIGIDCTAGCKVSYHTIKTNTVPQTKEWKNTSSGTFDLIFDFFKGKIIGFLIILYLVFLCVYALVSLYVLYLPCCMRKLLSTLGNPNLSYDEVCTWLLFWEFAYINETSRFSK